MNRQAVRKICRFAVVGIPIVVGIAYFAWAYWVIEGQARDRENHHVVATREKTDMQEAGVVVEMRVERDYIHRNKKIKCG